MTKHATISPSIIEALYEDAILLAEEARDSFALVESATSTGDTESERAVATSCEALRTTTRMMHAIAWLLNQKAYFADEISAEQLRQHGHLPPAQPVPDAVQMALLPRFIADLVDRSIGLYSRVERLDRAWRRSYEPQPAAVHDLRERLGYAFAR